MQLWRALFDQPKPVNRKAVVATSLPQDLFCLVQLCADSWALGSKPLNSSHTKHVSYCLQVESPAAQECWRGAGGQGSEGEASFFGTEASETPVRGRRAYAEELFQAFVELIIKVLRPPSDRPQS